METSGCASRPNQLKMNYRRWKMKYGKPGCSIMMLASICTFYTTVLQGVEMTSINHGINQRPITDISQLMPTLCQNQSVICEGSFCIPGLRRCVCDLRQPVQFGRFCLRQVDIETKCFVTNQCNHTIKDAVCVDTNSNTILDKDLSSFKLEQWQQLHELRQASKSAQSKQENVRQKVAVATSRLLKPMFLLEERQDELNFEARDDVILSSFRNSPYEINYYTPELLHQNHTRRKTTTSSSGEPHDSSPNDNQTEGSRQVATEAGSINPLERSTQYPDSTTVPTARTRPIDEAVSTASATSSPASSPQNDLKNAEASTLLATETAAPPTTTQQTSTLSSEISKKKMIVKVTSWPPGVCSCPQGHMFDSMLRKCLALSLADSHCQNDIDCKQIRLTHCSSETRKCECDEPLSWNQTELACQRPRPVNVRVDNQASSSQSREGFFENLLPPLLMAKLLPDQSMLLMIFVILVIICTLLLLRCVVKCFSSSNSALISPKNSKIRKSAAGDHHSINQPKSPYATLRKQADQHKANTPLANFTQATRGRILNYDFEQDQPIPDSRSPQSPQPQAATYVSGRQDQPQHQQQASHQHYGTLDKSEAPAPAAGSTLSRLKQTHKNRLGIETGSTNYVGKSADRSTANSECLELNDNVSLDGQLDSERKSESGSVQAIIGPPPTQAPPYMLASAMKGQGSAIAAAAAAVANRRMQMAHKKGLAESATGKVPNGTPVFL